MIPATGPGGGRLYFDASTILPAPLLHNIAIDPAFPKRPYIYLYISAPDGSLRVLRLHHEELGGGETSRASKASARLVWESPATATAKADQRLWFDDRGIARLSDGSELLPHQAFPTPMLSGSGENGYEPGLAIPGGVVGQSAPPPDVGSRPELAAISCSLLNPTASSVRVTPGKRYSFEATANDKEDGDLAPGQFTWFVEAELLGELHPLVGPLTGTRRIDFAVPALSELEPDDVRYWVIAIVRDSSGLQAQRTLELRPAPQQSGRHHGTVSASSAARQTADAGRSHESLSTSKHPGGGISALALRDGPLKLPTILDLRALDVRSVQAGDLVKVRGYHYEDDGGGGTFQYLANSTTPENGGTVIAPSKGSGRWHRLVAETGLRVRWFGARGDGETEDHAAITAAIAAAGPGGVLTFDPTGTSFYRVGEHLSLRPLTGQTWQMTGATVRKYGPSSPARSDNLIELEDVQNVTFVGGTLGYLSGNHLAIHAVKDSCRDIVFHGTTFDRLSSFIEKGNANFAFYDCAFLPGEKATNALSTGGYLEPLTGRLINAAGSVRGIKVIGGRVEGGKIEAIDINWDTQDVEIARVRFINNCRFGGEEVIDVGGASARGAAIIQGGAGYRVGDRLTLPGGLVSGSAYATWAVTATDGAGRITAVELITGGYYYKFPDATDLTPTGGRGRGAILRPEWGYCSNIRITDCDFELPADVEARVIRLKWETKDVTIANNRAIRPTLARTADTVAGSAIRMEQVSRITIEDNHWENLYEAYSIAGPASDITIRRDTVRHVYRQVLVTRSKTNQADIVRVRVEDCHLDATTLAPGEEAFDLNHLRDSHLVNNRIELAPTADAHLSAIRPTSRAPSPDRTRPALDIAVPTAAHADSSKASSLDPNSQQIPTVQSPDPARNLSAVQPNPHPLPLLDNRTISQERTSPHTSPNPKPFPDSIAASVITLHPLNIQSSRSIHSIILNKVDKNTYGPPVLLSHHTPYKSHRRNPERYQLPHIVKNTSTRSHAFMNTTGIETVPYRPPKRRTAPPRKGNPPPTKRRMSLKHKC